MQIELQAIKSIIGQILLMIVVTSIFVYIIEKLRYSGPLNGLFLILTSLLIAVVFNSNNSRRALAFVVLLFIGFMTIVANGMAFGYVD